MSDLVIFNNIPWKPPIKSKLLKPPTLQMTLKYSGDDLDDMTKKQRDAFDKAFKKFDSDFNKLGVDKMKEVQSAVEWTEERILEKQPKERQAVVDTANKMLQSAFKTFQGQIQALADKHYADALAASYKAMKMKLKKSKAKCIIKIVVISLLILTATGLSIAATVATGGAAAPLVIGVVLAGLKGAHSVYKTCSSNWASASNQIKQIQKDVGQLSKANSSWQKLQEVAAVDPKAASKVSKLKVKLNGMMVDIDKSVGQLDKYIFEVGESLKKQNAELQKVADEIAKSNDPKAIKQATSVRLNITKAQQSLRDMENVQKEAKAAKDEWDKKMSLGSIGKIEAPLKKLAGAAPLLMEIGKGLKTVGDAAKKLAKAA